MNTRTWKQIERLRKKRRDASATTAPRRSIGSRVVPRDASASGRCVPQVEPARSARALPDVAAGARRAVRGRAARPRRADRCRRSRTGTTRASSRTSAITGSRAGHPRRAADRRRSTSTRCRGDVAGRDRARAASTLDWLAQLLGLPRGLARPHRGHGLDGDDRRARRGARTLPARRRRRTRPSTRTSRSRRRRGCSGSSTATVPVDDEFRMRTDLSTRRRGRGRRDRRHDVVDVGRPGAGARRPLRGGGVWLHVDAAYAGSACGLSGAPLVPRRLRPRRLARRQPAQVAVHADRLLVPLDAAARGPARAFAAHAEYLRSSEDAIDLRDYGPALGRRFRALKLWTVLRCYGRDGLQALIREHVRLAALFEEWVRDEPGWEVCAPRHFSVVCFRRDRRRQRGARAARDRDRRDLRRDHDAPRRAASCGSRSATRARPRPTCAGVGGAARMRAVIFDLWDTLVDWPVGEGEELKRRVAEHVGGDPDAFEQAWRDELPRLADGAARRRAALARRPGRARRRARRARATSSAARVPAPARGRARGDRRAAAPRRQARPDHGLLRGGPGGLARDRARAASSTRDVLVASAAS